jgi:hypothetical protein
MNRQPIFIFHGIFYKRPILFAVVGFIVSVSAAYNCQAQIGTLAEPFPAPAANAALHYQRAMLLLSELDDNEMKPLSKPIWEVLPAPAEKQLPREVDRLLRDARFAVKSAAIGSRTAECNFGIDFNQLGAAAQLPHLKGMVHLGRLLTLRGAHAESQGEWEEAVIIYFDGLRVGRHLTHQNTLLEALTGIDILRNNYFAISRWSVRCPSRPLVARAFGLLESMQNALIEPSQVLARESSIMSLEFERLRDAYPDGNWAQMILESSGEDVTGKKQDDADRAISNCVKQGVPKKAFSSPAAFEEYVGKLQATANRFAESVTACVTLPPRARIQRAEALNRKYSKLITLLASDTMVDPVEIGTILAEHEAELVVTRLALAVSASKKDNKFPNSLQDVAERFGGDVPVNPYTREPVSYQVMYDGGGFSLVIPGDGSLPNVDFNSSGPEEAE